MYFATLFLSLMFVRHGVPIFCPIKRVYDTVFTHSLDVLTRQYIYKGVKEAYVEPLQPSCQLLNNSY